MRCARGFWPTGTRPTSSPLTGAGLEPERAGLGARTLVHFVIGHVNEEQQRVQLGPLAGEDAPPVPSGAEDFRAGVGLLLDGIAAQFP